jgi:hypothetical protein
MTDDWTDEELLAGLREALAARQAVPPGFVDAARGAFAWRTIDAELAQLTYDSLAGSGAAPVTRSEPASIRALTFTSPRLTIELEVAGDSLLGQVVPPQAATIQVQRQNSAGEDGDETVIEADQIGCFVIQPAPRGPFRLRCQTEASVDVLTGWITL